MEVEWLRAWKWFVLLIFISATNVGCVSHPTVQSAPSGKQEDVQSLHERELVLLFKTLLQLEKKDGYALTKAQASELLPVIQKNSSLGELTLADQKRILDILNASQRKFYEETQDLAKKRFEAMNKDSMIPDPMNVKERERMIEEFKKQRELEMKNPQSAAAGTAAPVPDPAVINKNVERQLIELLESKLK
jgi:hypothetical protein